MTRLTKTNKRSVKKSTPWTATKAVAEMNATEDELLDLEELNGMSYRELQAMAKEAGLKANGTKADLIERLS